MLLILTLERQRKAELSKYKTSMVDRTNSRTNKKKTKQKTKNKNKNKTKQKKKQKAKQNKTRFKRQRTKKIYSI